MSTQTHSNSPPPALQAPNEHHAAWLLRRIWDRVNRENEHFMGCIVGREGWGKSMTAMRIAAELDPTFTADRVLFKPKPLLETLRDRDHEQGQAYVLDESGVQLGRRSWHDKSQIMINQSLQLIRDHNLILILTLPRLGELDSQAQGRLHAAYEINEKQEGDHVRGSWYWLDPDRMDETGTIYKHFPKRRIGGMVQRVRSLAFTPLEAPTLLDNYEERKGEFQSRFYQETLDELEDEEDEEDDKDDPAAVAETILSNGGIESYINANNGHEYIDADLIAVDHGLADSDAKKVKKVLQRDSDL